MTRAVRTIQVHAMVPTRIVADFVFLAASAFSKINIKKKDSSPPGKANLEPELPPYIYIILRRRKLWTEPIARTLSLLLESREAAPLHHHRIERRVWRSQRTFFCSYTKTDIVLQFHGTFNTG